jgi:hypothetical protein
MTLALQEAEGARQIGGNFSAVTFLVLCCGILSYQREMLV